jgi:hypothetical protein
MFEVAFATCRRFSELTPDDQLVAEVLQARQVRVIPAVWDDPAVDWARFDVVVIRATWDYHLQPDRYAEWLGLFSTTSNRLWNPPSAVRQNMHKSYLAGLAQSGVPVVPTIYVGAADRPRLREVLHHQQWEEAVIKPAVSANAFGTWRTSLINADADQPRFLGELRERDLLLQPYLPEISSRGEWSLMFFRGQFSHAVLKRPADGEFRVQRDLGGSAVSAVPDASLVAQARAVLAAHGGDLLYARVDGIERDNRFLLMELEIIEPYLFLAHDRGAAGRFADAILQILPVPPPRCSQSLGIAIPGAPAT